MIPGGFYFLIQFYPMVFIYVLRYRQNMVFERIYFADIHTVYSDNNEAKSLRPAGSGENERKYHVLSRYTLYTNYQ
jgi:hypothetical protein